MTRLLLLWLAMSLPCALLLGAGMRQGARRTPPPRAGGPFPLRPTSARRGRQRAHVPAPMAGRPGEPRPTDDDKETT